MSGNGVISESAFFARFDFETGQGGRFGIESELVTAERNGSGRPTPRGYELVQRLAQPWATEELTQVQAEIGTVAATTCREVLADLSDRLEHMRREAAAMGCVLRACPAAPENMPRDITPTPKYIAMAEALRARGEEILLSALRVSSWQISLSPRSLDELIEMYNRLLEELDRLVAMTDTTGGLRRRLYRTVVPNVRPTQIGTPADMYRVALAEGWSLPGSRSYRDIAIRPGDGKKPPILELRFMDASDDIEFIADVLAEVIRIARFPVR